MRARFRSLDGLRGIAALLIVFYHFGFPNHFTHHLFVSNGYLAVDLFFMLSGFVIYASYSRTITNAASASRFICLRLFRIYPLHFGMLVILLGLELTKLIAARYGSIIPGQTPFTGGNTYEGLAANLFLVQGFPFMGQLTWNVPSWSISCEFVAYLIFAAVVVTGVFRSKMFFTFGIILSVLGYCALAFTRNTLDVHVWGQGLVRGLAGFFWGMLIFEFAAPRRTRLSTMPVVVIGSCEIAVTIALMLTMAFVSGPAILLVIPILIIVVAVFQLDRGPMAKLLMSMPVQFLGRISYSIYMVHMCILVGFTIGLKRVLSIPFSIDPVTRVPIFQIGQWSGDVLLLCIVLVVLGASAVTCIFIEEPARRYGRRLLSHSSPVLGPPVLQRSIAR
jgi:peptidoglycan/LPS O-acetylase OafA/YrhL